MKTGFTTAAGYSVVAAAERDGERLVAVVLGEHTEAFSDAAALLDYGFRAFDHRTLVREGQALAPLIVHGERIPVAAGGALESLIPTAAANDLRRRARLDPGAPFPPRVGQAVGTLVFSAPGLSVGQVPLIVSRATQPPPATGGPWWRRAASSVREAVSAAIGSLLR